MVRFFVRCGLGGVGIVEGWCECVGVSRYACDLSCNDVVARCAGVRDVPGDADRLRGRAPQRPARLAVRAADAPPQQDGLRHARVRAGQGAARARSRQVRPGAGAGAAGQRAARAGAEWLGVGCVGGPPERDGDVQGKQRQSGELQC